MLKSQNRFIMNLREKKKFQETKEKEERRKGRQEKNAKGDGLFSMITDVDEFANITSTPPEKTNPRNLKRQTRQMILSNP
jgi:hypothetical protein